MGFSRKGIKRVAHNVKKELHTSSLDILRIIKKKHSGRYNNKEFFKVMFKNNNAKVIELEK